MPPRPGSTTDLLLRLLLQGPPFPDDGIDPRDSSWRYLEKLHRGIGELARVSYFRSGWSMMRVIDQILDWRFGASRDRARILDFASGYGRATRFLVLRHPAERVCVSDLFADAVTFQRARFGVSGFASTPRPDDLEHDEVFDLVTVFSLFSHLPRASFGAWLRCLWDRVAPGGVLVFSTMGELSLVGGRTMPGDGFLFEPSSHLVEIEPEEYGSTWVRESWVGELLATMLAPGDTWVRLPCAVWAQQDVYVVARGPGPDPGRLAFRWEPMAWLEECSHRDGSLRLGGWSWDLAGHEVDRLDVLLEGRPLGEARPSEARADVATHLGVPEGARTGWRFETSTGETGADPRDRLLVVARARSGESYVAHLASLESTLLAFELDAVYRQRDEVVYREARERKARVALWYELRRVRAEVELYQRTLAASRFWKARELWWKLRRRLLPKTRDARESARRGGV